MPIYAYQCIDCNRIWDELRHSSERDEPATCSRCEAPANRLVSASANPVGNFGTVHKKVTVSKEGFNFDDDGDDAA